MRAFTVTQTLTAKRIANVLTSALEGGSNYWYRLAHVIPPTTWELESESRDKDGRHYIQDAPLNPGGELLIVDELSDDDGVLTLDGNALQRGLNILAEKYPMHLSAILAEKDDSGTGDAFLQCCLLGDVLYSE
jgi:hypothetical protein